MIIKPTAWMQELPKEEGVERAVRTTTVKEVADDWKNPSPLYTADDLQDAVLAEREACAEVAESYEPRCDVCPKGVANAIRARGET
jgi:hypothetical protein